MNLTRKDKIMNLIKLLLLSVALAVAVGNGYAAADNNKIEPIKMLEELRYDITEGILTKD